MEWQFYVFLLGTLAAVVALIVFGAILKGTLGAVMLIAGVVGAVAWLIMFVQIASAMNSDI